MCTSVTVLGRCYLRLAMAGDGETCGRARLPAGRVLTRITTSTTYNLTFVLPGQGAQTIALTSPLPA